MGYCSTLSKFEKAGETGKFKKDGRGYYKNESAISNLVKYILRVAKGGNEICIRYAGVRNIRIGDGSPKDIIRGIKAWQEYVGKTSGRRMYHYVLSFAGQPDAKVVDNIARMVMNYFFVGVQVVYAVHEDTNNIHIHFALGAVMVNGKKINYRKAYYYELKKEIEECADAIAYENKNSGER